MAPTLRFSDYVHGLKYRMPNENFRGSTRRQAHALSDDQLDFDELFHSLYYQELLLGGRIQAAIGTGRDVTPYNCFVSRTIHDSMDSILTSLNEAIYTMRLGGGIGYDFSNLRPRGWTIKSLGSQSSGPVSFMKLFDAGCDTIQSAGHRRGAEMGCLRVSHPDIREFIYAKMNNDVLTNFNLSVLVTDEFMEAVREDELFPLEFDGYVTEWVRAQSLWNEITAMTWDWAEPGVIFIDRINDWNNLWYCEDIRATNPCAEQPLPPYGACLLGSLNMTKFLVPTDDGAYAWDQMRFEQVTRMAVRAAENVIDQAHYPLEEQRREAKEKRRMGLGVTGFANTLEALGMPYGSSSAIEWADHVFHRMAHAAYDESVELAKERGAFPLLDRDKYLQSRFVNERLDPWLQRKIKIYGIRNSHLMSTAPTGTISLVADNVSSGVEPPYDYGVYRPMNTPQGQEMVFVPEYGSEFLGVRGRTTEDLTCNEHLAILAIVQKWMDSSVSKTVNVGSLVTFPQFKDIYQQAYYMGAKSCSTFRKDGKRFALLQGNSGCDIDPESGQKECE